MNNIGAEAVAPGTETGAVKSAKRVLDIISLVAGHDDGLTFAEVAAALGLPKSSAHALLGTMTSEGYLDLDRETRRFTIGLRCWEAGQAHTRTHHIVRVARPHMIQARDELTETIQLSVLDGLENVYLDKVDGTHFLTLASHVGSRLPAHATGLGKVLLANLDPNVLLDRLDHAELKAFTRSTITDRTALLDALAVVREQRYAVDHGEYSLGVLCVAVPIHDHTGSVTAAMSCSMPEVRVAEETPARLLRVLRREVAVISKKLGYRPLTPEATNGAGGPALRSDESQPRS